MGEAAEARRDTDRSRSTWLALGITVVVLLSAVPMPHMGDQALFQLGAEELLSGGVLYTDFWDLKQPGIFWFFAVAEWANIDPHVLELIWALGLAFLSVSVARTFAVDRRVASLAAVTCVAWPYAVATSSVLTQVELLAGLPMLGALAAARLAVISESRVVRDVSAVLLGICVVVVALLKLMLLGALAATLMALWWGFRSSERSRLVRSILIAAATVVCLSGLVVGVLASRGALGDAMRTWFIVPLGAGSRAGRSVTRLIESGAKFAAVFALLVAVGLVGAWRLWSRRDAVGVAVIVWIVAGGATIVAQLGWYYLTSFIVVPLGLLAVAGVEELVERRPRSWSPAARLATLAAVAVLALPAVVVFGQRVAGLAAAEGAVTAADRQEFRSEYDAVWRDRSEQAADLRAAVGPDEDVVLWGDPLILELAGRRSAISVNGWSPEHLDQTLWRRAADEMREAVPDFIVVDAFSATMIDARGRSVGELLDEQYEVWRETPGLTWYVPLS